MTAILIAAASGLFLVGVSMIAAGLWSGSRPTVLPKQVAVVPKQVAVVPKHEEEAPSRLESEWQLFDEARRQMDKEMEAVLLKARQQARNRGMG